MDTKPTRITYEEAEREVLRNYRVFRNTFLPELLNTNHGEWVLLHDRQITGLFTSLEAAYREGIARFPGEKFSIQEIREQNPVDLGWFSHVV